MSRENAQAPLYPGQSLLTLPAWLVLVLVIHCPTWLFSQHSDQRTSNAERNEKAKLIFFTAPWCAPCQQIKPYIVRICDQNKTVVQLLTVDHDAAPALVKEFEVESLPTLILLDRSGTMLIRVNDAGKEGLNALGAEIRRLARTNKKTRGKSNVEASDLPSRQ